MGKEQFKEYLNQEKSKEITNAMIDKQIDKVIQSLGTEDIKDDLQEMNTLLQKCDEEYRIMQFDKIKESQKEFSDLKNHIYKYVEYLISPIDSKEIKLQTLNYNESKLVLESIFGSGVASNLVYNLSQGNACFLKRYIALGKLEGSFEFGKFSKNGRYIGTFQIGNKENKLQVVENYINKINIGLKMAGVNVNLNSKLNKNISPTKNLDQIQDILLKNGISLAQQDLLAHIGYIQSDRGGEQIFAQLRDDKLSQKQLISLISSKIQGGHKSIGIYVAKHTMSSRGTLI